MSRKHGLQFAVLSRGRSDGGGSKNGKSAVSPSRNVFISRVLKENPACRSAPLHALLTAVTTTVSMNRHNQ